MNYPPGTPIPHRISEPATCSECGRLCYVTLHHELGTVEAIPEESPCCGAEWSWDDPAEDEE